MMFDVPFLFGSGWDRTADTNAEAVIVLTKAMNERLFGGENSVGRRLRMQGTRVPGGRRDGYMGTDAAFLRPDQWRLPGSQRHVHSGQHDAGVRAAVVRQRLGMEVRTDHVLRAMAQFRIRLGPVFRRA